MGFDAYVLCATPRSGSTLLCDLLTASGVAGAPNSFFRADDIAFWAEEWRVAMAPDATDGTFDPAYLAAMKAAGSAGTGLFGLRLMWDSVPDAAVRLAAATGSEGDLAALIERAFGRTLFIHLSREDTLAQAISLVRAQQSGLWHVAADGGERERLAPPRTPTFDAGQIARAHDRLTADDAGWNAFFADHQIVPFRLTYERLAAAPRRALADVLAALGRDPARAATVDIVAGKMADGESAEWATRFSGT